MFKTAMFKTAMSKTATVTTLSKVSLSLAIVAISLPAATLFAQDFDFSIDLDTRAATTEVMNKYRDRLVDLKRTAQAVEEERQEVLDQLYAELDEVLGVPAVSPTKNALDCQKACTRVTAALGQIGDAESLSRSSWLTSCSSSSNASNAFTYAHNSENDTQSVKLAVCSPSPTCNVNVLRDARDNAFDAWISAEDAYDNDGCNSDMQSAEFKASDAYINLVSADNDCNNC